MRKSLLTSLTLLILTGGAFAQKKGVNNVININMHNVRAIKKGHDITGYFMFYKADKIKGGDYSYRLRIMDENVNEVAEKKIIASKYLYLIEAQYNQELLCFKFYDAKEKKISLKFYDKNGDRVASKSYEPDKIEVNAYKVASAQDMQNNPTVFPVGDKGFLNYRIVKNDKPGYEIKYYPNSKEVKGWKHSSKKTSPVVEYASLLEANEKIILNRVILQKGKMSRDQETHLSGLDPASGDEIFNTKLENSKYEESLLNSHFNDATNEIYLFGYYFPKGENVMGGQSLGMSMTVMDLKGKIKSKSYISWDKDVAKLLPAKLKGRIKEIGFIYFHEFVTKADGTIFGIGEQYRKTVSAGGTALKALAVASGSTGSGSVAQITIGDFFIFEFNKDFTLKGVEVIEKSTSRVQLPAGAAYYGPQFLALYVESLGGFDYNYLKQLDNGNTFSVYYRNYEKRKGEKNKSIIGVISNTNGTYVTDKVDIYTEADYVKVLPAQGSNVLFFEYYKKEKEIKMNFQKMNY